MNPLSSHLHSFHLPSFILAATLALTTAAQAQQPHPSLPDLSLPNSVGVNIHFTDAKPGEMEMIAKAGFRIARMDFAWSATEQEKGVYNFSEFDRLLKQLEAFKIQPLFILDYSNFHYDQDLSPYSNEGRAAFAKWAAAAVVHFKGHKVLWEMYNEPNGFWRPKTNIPDYIKLAVETGKAIKAAAPSECFIGPGLSGFDFDFFEACFSAGVLEYFDGVSVHPYRGNYPESAGEDYRRLRLMIEQFKPKGKSIPVLSGEWGYSTKGVSEEQQAKFLARQWLSNLSNNVPVSIWYDWHNDGSDPTDNEHNFGTVRHEYKEGQEPVYAPKPSYSAAQTLTLFFEGYRFNKRLNLEQPGDYLLVFTTGQDERQDVRLAAWTTGSEHEITIPASEGEFKALDFLNEKETGVKATPQGLRLLVSDKPTYLRPLRPNALLAQVAQLETVPLERGFKAPFSLEVGGTTISLKRDSTPLPLDDMKIVGDFKITQSSLAVVTNPVLFELEPQSGARAALRLSNPYGDPLDGTLSFGPLAKSPMKFATGERAKELSAPMPKPDASGSWQIDALIQDSQTKDSFGRSFRFKSSQSFAQIDPQNLKAAVRIEPDGDPKIPSEQELTLADAPSPMPQPGPVFRLKYKFSMGWKFLQVKTAPDTPHPTKNLKSLGMWVYSDTSGNLVRMRFIDSTGQTFQANGTPLNWKGWKYVQFPFDNLGGHWGGANDGVIHGDVTIDTHLLLDNATQKEGKGEIYFGTPSLIESVPIGSVNGP